MGLFSSNKTSTQVDVLSEIDVQVTPENYITIDNSAFADTLSGSVEAIKSLFGDGLGALGGKVENLGEGIGGGLSRGGVNLAFAAIIAAGLYAISRR